MNSRPDIANIRVALGARAQQPKPFQPHPDHAAVALALAGTGDNLQLCLIRRVEHPSDPWSGHMALPGGRASPGDRSARAVAEREAREEVSLDLGDAQWQRITQRSKQHRLVSIRHNYQLWQHHSGGQCRRLQQHNRRGEQSGRQFVFRNP